MSSALASCLSRNANNVNGFNWQSYRSASAGCEPKEEKPSIFLVRVIAELSRPAKCDGKGSRGVVRGGR